MTPENEGLGPLEALRPDGTPVATPQLSQGPRPIKVCDSVWVRLEKIVAVHVGVTDKTSYLTLENVAEPIWVPLKIEDTLAAIGWLK